MEKAMGSQQYQNLIAWLTEARITNGWGQRVLAAKLDVAYSFVHRVESLERRLDVYEYVIYCHALGVNPSAGLRFFAKPSPAMK
jgi:ribosome-binding protein aMBF1 (putative translation factor)